MILIDKSPAEGSAIALTVSFNDFDKTGFTPISCVWSLTDSKGNVINNRDRVLAVVTGATHTFVLSGSDLLYAEDKGRRVFTVEGTYDSVYGLGLPFREEASFTCRDTVINPL